MPKGSRVKANEDGEFTLPDGAVFGSVGEDPAELLYIFVVNEDVYTCRVDSSSGEVKAMKYRLDDSGAAKAYAQGIRNKRSKGGTQFSQWQLANFSQTQRMHPGNMWAQFPISPASDSIHTLLAEDSADALFSAMEFGQDEPATAAADPAVRSSSSLPNLAPHMDPNRYLKELMDGV